MYSHNNVAWTLESARRVLELHNETLLSYLPLAHVAGAVHLAVGRHLQRSRGVPVPGSNELLALPHRIQADRIRRSAAGVEKKLMAGLQAGIAAEPDESKKQMAQGRFRPR